MGEVGEQEGKAKFEWEEAWMTYAEDLDKHSCNILFCKRLVRHAIVISSRYAISRHTGSDRTRIDDYCTFS
jgi:hypothetical protein